MAVTPHISLRVPSSKLESWRKACEKNNTDISSQIRKLMDAWVKVEQFDADSQFDQEAYKLMVSFVEVSEGD